MSVISEKPFQPQKLEEERAKKKGKIFTIRLNAEELKLLKADMKLLKQVKPSTTVKILWAVGRNVLHDEKTGLIYRVLLDNLRRNERLGIVTPEVEISQM